MICRYFLPSHMLPFLFVYGFSLLCRSFFSLTCLFLLLVSDLTVRYLIHFELNFCMRCKFVCGVRCVHAKSFQLCPTLCDPMDHSLPGSSVHGILQARILEWFAISFFKGSSQPRGQTCVSNVYCIGRQVLNHWCHLG